MSRSPSRAVYAGLRLPKVKRARRRSVWRALGIAALCVLCALLYLFLSLREVCAATALSEAQDLMQLRLAESVRRLLAQEEFAGGFVRLETDGAGTVTAVTTDTAQVNLLAAGLLEALVAGAEEGEFDLRMPLGTLVGGGMLVGLGPKIPIRVGVMRSSSVRFESGFDATGINQSRYRLSLLASIDLDLLIPWGEAHGSVSAEIPVSDTIVVGRVPGIWVGDGAGME